MTPNRIRAPLTSLPLKQVRQIKRKALSVHREFLMSPGKILAEKPGSLRLTLAHLARHLFLAGGSGNGKSTLIRLLFMQIATQRGPDGRLLAGAMLVDPHGDTYRAVVRYLASIRFNPADVLCLEPSMDGCFAFDPAADAPRGVSREEYEQWLAATVDRIVKAILRNVAAADQEVMNRLKRWLKNVLTACLVATDDRNTHVGADKALIFTDPGRPEFSPLYAQVKDHLPPDIRADFEKLIDTKRSRDQEAWVESTINRLREILSPIVRLIFGQHAASLDLRAAIRQRKLVLVNLAESEFLSREQGNVVGGLLINFLLGTARRTPEGERTDFFLVIDEAENYMGEDLRMGFAELRKFRLILVVIVQDLSCLRKGELDLVGKVVSQCGLQMTFQQQNPEDVEYLAKAYGYGALDFTRLLTDVVLPDGYDWVDTRSVSVGLSATMSRSSSVSTTRTHSETRQQHTAESIQASVSRALSESESEGESLSLTQGTTTGHSVGRTEGASTSHAVGHSEGSTTSRGVGRTEGTSLSHGVGRNEGTNSSHSVGRNEGTSTSHSVGTSDGGSEQTSRGRTWTDSIAHSQSTTSSRSRGESSQESLSESQSESRSTSDGRSTTLSGSEGSSFGPGGLTTNRSNGRGHGTNESTSSGASRSSAVSQSRGESTSESEGETEGRTETSSDGGSETRSRGSNWSDSESWGSGTNRGRSESWSEGESQGKSESWTEGESRGKSETRSEGESRGTSETRSAGQSRGTSETQSSGQSQTVGQSKTAARTRGVTNGVSIGQGRTKGESQGDSDGESHGETNGTGQAAGMSITVSHQKAPLARHKITKEDSGRLRTSVTDQLAKFANTLASLPDRTLLVKCKGMGVPFLLAVHTVAEPAAVDVKGFLSRVYAAHACFFNPGALRKAAIAPAAPPAKPLADDEENPIA